MPQLEHQQLPQAQRVIAAARQMLRHQAVDESRLEVAALAGPRRLQGLDHEVASAAAEPRTDRHTEAMLRALDSTSAGRSRAATFFSTRFRSQS